MNKAGKYKEPKKVVFYESPDQHARLLIQLFYDNLKQGEFFRAIVNGYASGDKDLFRFIQNYKLNNGANKTQRKTVIKEQEMRKDLENKFALDQEEIEDIFDILEEEYLKT
jgi:regulatory protein YycH of two-component signal transduction system YycFG|tara:strand:+ start:786 stop:1118 length:333 start_codon:yes stop_codon:yes gene_type:complete